MNKLSILIADSTSSVRQFIKYALEDHFPGVVIEMANNGKNIQQRLESGSFDLILYEREMPLLDGFMLLEWIRKHQILKTLSFIMMSSATDEESIKKAVQLGADSYLVKPFKADSIVSKVTSVLNRQERKRPESSMNEGGLSIRTNSHHFQGKLSEVTVNGLSGVIDIQEHLPHILEKVEVTFQLPDNGRVDGVPGVIVRMEAAEAIPQTRHIAISVRFIESLTSEKKREIEALLSASR